MIEAIPSGGPGDGSGISTLLNDLNRMVDPTIPEDQQRASGRNFVSDAIRLGLPQETIHEILWDLTRQPELGRAWFMTLDPREERGRERLSH